METIGTWVRHFRRWYSANFLRGFCYYLPLVVLFLLPAALVLGVIAAEYGAQLLFFHDEPFKQMLVGASLSWYWSAILATGYLLWLRDGREGRIQPYFVQLSRRAAGAGPHLPDSYTFYVFFTVVSVAATIAGYWLVVMLGEVFFNVLQGPGGTADPGPASEGPRQWTLRRVWLLLGVFEGAGLQWLLARFGPGAAHRVAMYVRALGRPDGPAAAPGFLPRAVAGFSRYVLGTSLGVVWLYLLYHLTGEALKDPAGYVGPAVATAFGLWITVAAAARTEPWLLWGAVAANGLLAFAAVSWCVSTCPYGALAGGIAALAAAAVLIALVRSFLPERWEKGREAVTAVLAPLGPRETEALGWVLLATALFPIHAAVATLSPLASPAAILLLPLFVVVGVYGLFTFLVRRTFVVVLGALALLAFVGNVQRYKTRFDVGIPYDRAEQLQQLADADALRQDRFDGLLKQYVAVGDAIENAEVARDSARAALDDPANTSPDLIEVVRRNLQDAEAELDVQSRERERLRDDLRTAWNTMERENRVRGGALRPGVSELVTRGRPVAPDRLLTADDLEVYRAPGERAAHAEQERAWLPGLQAAASSAAFVPVPRRPLVVIAVSGGGMRAAYWTFQVLAELELTFAAQADGRPWAFDFPTHVRLITGASGGMLGAAYYVATLPTPDDRARMTVAERQEQLRWYQQRLAGDFLTPLVRDMVLSDLPGVFSPWPLRHDRGRALEQAWAKHLKAFGKPDGPGALEATFAQLRDGEKEGWRPSLVFTPMTVEDGRRLAISNLDLRYVVSNDVRALTPDPSSQGIENQSIDALELFRLFPASRGGVRVATAVRMSASFPYFSPAASLPTVPRRRVVDAGYYDNYGMSLASSWLFSGMNAAWRQRHFDRVLVVQIRDGWSVPQRQLRTVAPYPSDFLSRSFEEITTPPEGLFNARVGSSSFRNDGSVEVLDQMENLRLDLQGGRLTTRLERFKQTPAEANFGVVTFELRGAASLTWTLSRDDLAPFLDPLTATELQGKIGEVIRWWNLGRPQEVGAALRKP